MGKFVEGNNNPDLTFAAPALQLRGEHTQEYMASDHAFLCLTVSASPKRIKWKSVRITDWHKYRKRPCTPPFIDVTTWTQLMHALDKHSLVLTTSEVNPHKDKYLSHCQEAPTSLLKPWIRCKTNCRFRARINLINEHFQEYVTTSALAYHV